jgi:hypothetical protein
MKASATPMKARIKIQGMNVLMSAGPASEEQG